jgi:hypothetical protein
MAQSVQCPEYRLGDRDIGVQCPAQSRDIFLHTSILHVVTTYLMGTPGVKQPEGKSDHSPPPSADVMNAWRYTSTPPPMCITARGLIKHRNKSMVCLKRNILTGNGGPSPVIQPSPEIWWGGGQEWISSAQDWASTCGCSNFNSRKYKVYSANNTGEENRKSQHEELYNL